MYNEESIRQLDEQNTDKKKIFVNGTFDIIHVGHLELLNHARRLGDHLVVAIDSDERVREKKGFSRPVFNQMERLHMLMNIRAVDEVYIFVSDDGLRDVIKKVNPDIIVVGSDWKGKGIIGSEYAGCVQYFDRIPGFSTTEKIQSIIDRG